MLRIQEQAQSARQSNPEGEGGLARQTIVDDSDRAGAFPGQCEHLELPGAEVDRSGERNRSNGGSDRDPEMRRHVRQVDSLATADRDLGGHRRRNEDAGRQDGQDPEETDLMEVLQRRSVADEFSQAVSPARARLPSE